MEAIENTGQALDFKCLYIVTANFILLYDSYIDYRSKCDQIEALKIPEGHELFFNPSTETFYTQAI